MLSKLIEKGKYASSARPAFAIPKRGVWCVLALVCAAICIAGLTQAQVKAELKLSGIEAAFQETLDNGDRMGNAITSLGDLDGDGVDDVAVGSRWDTFGGDGRGAVWILFLNADGTVKYRQMIASGRGGFTGVLDNWDGFGYSVGSPGDIDDDGVNDLVVGAPFDDDGGDAKGAVYVLFLRTDGTVKSHQKISATDGGFAGTLLDRDFFGYSVCGIGDLDGDSFEDIVVGAAQDDDGDVDAGAVWVLFLDTTGQVVSHQKISSIEGGFGGVLDIDDYFGSSVAAIGDLDGDLNTELAVGAKYDDDGFDAAGAVWILFMNDNGTVLSEQKISATAGGFGGTLATVDYFGHAVTGMGDYNSDGVEDVLVGAPSASGASTGSAWIVYLADDGTVAIEQEITEGVGGFSGNLDVIDHFGSALTMANDLNGDGFPDMVVCAEQDDDGGTNRGASWVLFMNITHTVGSHQKISDTTGGFNELILDAVAFGSAMTVVGDINGDDVDDVVIGASGDDVGGNATGAVWVCFMNADGSVAWHQKIGVNAGGFAGVLDPLDQFGLSVTGLGDLDLDGVEDIAVGAPLDDDGGTPPNANRGAVWVLFLNWDGTVKSHYKIATATGGFESTLNDGDFFGYSLAHLGDLDGDGTEELAVGAINDNDNGNSHGAVWILSMDSIEVDSASKTNETSGGFAGVLDDNDYFGTSLANLGDINGDGINDLAVGCIGDDDFNTDAGAVWILMLRDDRWVIDQQKISSYYGLLGVGLEESAAFGYAAAALEDMDGDGVNELAVSATNDDDGGTDVGAVYLLFLDSTGVVKSHGKISATSGGFGGVLGDDDVFGSSIAPLWDTNSDSIPDLMVGHRHDDNVGTDDGAAWVISLDEPDADSDGVYYAFDACPAVDASFFDRDGDGCMDDYIGARHIEYWGPSDTLRYYIHVAGAPYIGDGTDFSAIINAMATWSAVPGIGTEMTPLYSGTEDWDVAVAGDGKNFVTFSDFDYDFGAHTLAVGIATSAIEPTSVNGKFYRPGQIIDSDMIFNPAKTFSTSGTGEEVDLESVATHEAGHLFGISHSPNLNSAMFYMLPEGTLGRTLKTDDETIFQKAYYAGGWAGLNNRVEGRVEDYMGVGVPGVAVSVTDTASVETVASDFTLPDGTFQFVGLPVGEYWLSIQPLDGSAAIGNMIPDYVNALVGSTAVINFPGEYWNTGDGTEEDPLIRTPIGVGGPVSGIVVVTNVDTTGPVVTGHSPGTAETGVLADAAVVIQFDEPIDHNSVSGNFRVYNNTLFEGVGGSGVVSPDGTVLSFTPTGPFEYETAYLCTLRTGITDKYGNPMSDLYYFWFDTETAPDLALSSLVSNKGVVGSVVVMNGYGFSSTPIDNTVEFTDEAGTGVVSASVVSATPTQLVVNVPPGSGTGLVTASVGANVSNGVGFVVLEDTGVPRGYELGSVGIGGVPRDVAVLPDGDVAYVATSGGAVAVNVDPALAGFLATTSISIPGAGELNKVSVTPDGLRIYGVSELDSTVYVIDRLTNTVVDQLDVHDVPRDATIGPSGNRAYVPTSGGQVQIWDVKTGSGTYNTLIGGITSPDANLRGGSAIDPTGEYLVVPSGTGKLIVFHIGPDSFLVDVGVGADPRDVVIDAAGQRAYVMDGSGQVTIVSIGAFTKVYDIATSGSLRGGDINPSGSYLFAANRQLNFLDIIDLIDGSPTYRTVASTIPTGVNPVDVKVSSDGLYAYALEENSQQLVVLGIGSGPIIKTLSRDVGVAGTILVATGEGFGTHTDSLVCRFVDANSNGFNYAPIRTTGRAVSLRIPYSAATGYGALYIQKVSALGNESSNTVSIEVLDAVPDLQSLRLASSAQLYTDKGLTAAVAMSPTGDQLIVGTDEGLVAIVDTDPNSPTFNQRVAEASWGADPPHDIVVRPDGKRAYVSVPQNNSVKVIDIDPASPGYGTVVGDVVEPNSPKEMAMSPDGEMLLVWDDGMGMIHHVQIYPGALGENTVVDTFHINGVTDIAFHPAGSHVFLTLGLSHRVTTLDVDSTSAEFRQRAHTLLLPSPEVPPLADFRNQPIAISFVPEGDYCFVLTDDEVNDYHYVYLLEVPAPDTLLYNKEHTYGFGISAPPPSISGENIDVAPNGNRMAFHQTGSGLCTFENDDAVFGSYQLFNTPFFAGGDVDQDYSIDGRRLYAVSTNGDSLMVFDYAEADTLLKVSGDAQTGVISQSLPAKLRVKVVGGSGPASGVAVTFNVASGGGVFTTTNTATEVAVTNSSGYADVSWTLGSTVGAQSVTATALGLVGSPLTFIADAVVDPNTLPLQLVDVLPADASTGVAVTTTVAMTFSRGVATSTVDTNTVYFHKTGETVVVKGEFGFTDENRLVSITPHTQLEFSTSYTLEVTSGVEDTNTGALNNPSTKVFTTEAAPPFNLTSVSPPSATSAVTIVLGGVGFNTTTAQNKVFFNSVEAIPSEGGYDYLKVTVPVTADGGENSLRVYNGADTSNALSFTVLVPSPTTSDEVVATIGTGAATKAAVVTPDGSRAYTVSPEGDMVIPVDMNTATSLPGITVGDHPISIDVHPGGTFVYVPNFESGTLSIIDVDPLSTNYNQVVETLLVGAFPTDVVVSPDGTWVYCVNAGSDFTKNVDIIDADVNSANHHSVVSSVGSSKSTKSVTINPDGSMLYTGTDDGYVVLNAGDLSYSVVATVKTGKSTKSVTINPDGSLLIILTTDGDILIIDIVPGSANENTVIATVRGGSNTKSVTINPDGTLLYLVLEENDIIEVIEINIEGAVGVSPFDAASLPPFQVTWAVVDSVLAGEDPEVLVFDPRGTGTALVTNSGPQTVTLLNTSFVEIELVADVLTIPAFSQVPYINLDGFEMKNVSGRDYSFSYEISTVGPATLSSTIPPAMSSGGGGILTASPAAAFASDTTSLGGVTPVIAPGDSFAPPPAYLVIPAIRDHLEQLIVYRVSPIEVPNLVKLDSVWVIIDAPVPVFVQSFVAEAIDVGVRLAWDVVSDEEVTGYKIYRRNIKTSAVEIANPEGLIDVEAREFLDQGARPGEGYLYSLGIVLSDGNEVLSAPVEVKTQTLRLALKQNFPNPFNPTTTIAFTVPQKQQVTLIVYNVQGQRVATLVDRVMETGFKQVGWDGRSASGSPVSSGVYFYRLQAGSKTLTKKMVLLK